MRFPEIDDAHHELVKATAQLTKPGADPLPISLVSVDDREGAQLVVFDGLKWPKSLVVQRLRTAADFLDKQPSK